MLIVKHRRRVPWAPNYLSIAGWPPNELRSALVNGGTKRLFLGAVSKDHPRPATGLSVRAVALAIALLTTTLNCGHSAFGQYGSSNPVAVVSVKSQTNPSSLTAGKGFAIRFGGRNVVLSCAHGIAEALDSYVDIPTLLSKVESISLLNLKGEELGKLGACLFRRAGNWRYSGNDLLAFDLPNGMNLQVFSLSPTVPAVGSRVWVLSKVGHNFSTSSEADRFPGHVVRVSAATVTVNLDQPLSAFHSSGSPVVDGRNDVVGMLVGIANGRQTVVCCSCVSIAQHLNAESIR